MLAIPFGLYQTVFEYPGRSLILLVYVSPSFQLTCKYYPSGASLMFDRYFPLMKALRVYWFLRRHKCSSIQAYDAAASIVYTTRIMLAFLFLCENAYCASYVLPSIFNTACGEVWQNTSPVDGISSHYLVGITIIILHDASLEFINFLSPPLSGGLFPCFPFFVFLNASELSLIFAWVDHSLFTA